MARFYPYPYSSALIRTLLLIFLLVFIVAGYVQAQTAPTISNFSPTSGSVGTEVTITGSGFTTANMVYVGSEATLAFEILSDTQIKVNVPATASNGRIQVHTSVGAISSSTNFTVSGAPTISSIVPTTGPVGTPVTITGTNLEGVTSVSIAGATVTDFIVVSNTEIQLTIPTDAYGGGARVTANHGSASGTQSFTVTGTPTVASFDPASGPVGTTVTIKGTGFDNISSVIVGGAAVSGFTRISATEIKATVASTAAGGTVRVITSAGAGVSSGSFNVTGTPTITSLSASYARVGQEITINGSGFSGAYRVYFGSGYTDEVTIINGNQIKAVIPNTASTGKVTVYTSIGRATSANNLSIEGAPIISSFSPTSGNVGTVVTIRGKNFTEANTVVFGSGSTTNFTVISDTEIQVLVPSVASSGVVRVYANSGRALSSGQFILNNAPVITSFSPASGPAGTEVTLTGQNFTGASLLYVGNGQITNYTVISDTEIKLIIPVTATTGTFLVRTPSGQVNSSGQFRLTGMPVVASFTPSSGPIGQVVTVTGQGFANASLVFFGNSSTANFTIVSDTEIRVPVPATAATGKIQVRNASGSGYSTANFTVTGAPVITSFSPASGPAGTEVTLTGQNFTGASLLYVGNGQITNYTVISDTEIKLIIPVTATTGTFLVRTPSGQVNSSGQFNKSSAYISTTKPDITFNRGQSSTQEYKVSGLGLKNGQAVTINVGEASPFTISLNPGDGFGKTITLNSVANNRLIDTPIYVKYTATETDTEAEFEVQHVQTSVAQKALRVAIITPLPVELTSFTAKLNNGTVRLDWSTASEKDNSHFEIERSSGSMSNYRKVARVDSKVGTSAITTNYSISLNYSSNGQTEYYRLKQVDFDGTATYSRSVAVRPNMVAKPTLIAPNPIAADSKIYLTAQQAGTAVVRVTSIRGKQIYFEQMPVQAGENALPLSKYKNLMAGIYIVTVEFDGKQEFIRIMKN